ncbi:MAG: glycosyltransferase family 4 protein [Patescibacteria group bacterium]|jgi:glycosyltransferase involved in cell wall biosynthesis
MTNSLEIIFLDFDDRQNPLLGAGQAKATFEVGRRLVQKGHRVTVVSCAFPGCSDRIEEGIEYKHIALGTRNIRINNLMYIAALPFIVRKLRADIILECFTPPFSALFSPLWTRIPVVVIPSSFDANHFSRVYHLPFYIVEKVSLSLYRYYLPYSDYYDQKMRKMNPRVTSQTVPQGVEEVFFEVPRKKSEFILFLGRLEITQKGIDLLLDAYSRIKNKIDYPLVIAGNGPDEKKVKSLIREYDLKDRVVLTGPAFGSEKLDLLSKSLYVVLPSRFEGFSLFALEALASGLLLVLFNIPALGWVHDDVSYKAPCFNTEKYAELMIKLAKPSKAREKGEKAREFAAKYTWDEVTNQYENFFYKVVHLENGKQLQSEKAPAVSGERVKETEY